MNKFAALPESFYSSIFKLETGRLKSLRDLLLADAFLPLSSPINTVLYILIRTVRSYLLLFSFGTFDCCLADQVCAVTHVS